MLTEVQKKYHREYMREYRQINHDKILSQRRPLYAKQYSLHKDSRSEKLRTRYANDPVFREQKKQKAREYHNNNLDKIKEYRIATKEQRAKQRKIWREKNKEAIEVYQSQWIASAKDTLSDIKCKRPDCNNMLTEFQVQCKAKYCSKSCQVSERNRSRARKIELPKCANPNCEKLISRKQALARRKFCSKTCATVFSNGYIQYNPRACEYFAQFDLDNNTQGQYATNGGEYFIPKLGYFLDYINPALKVIIEYDEPHHYFKNGKLKPKDVIRQERIQKYFPNYQFIRIKENNLKFNGGEFK